MPKMYDVSTDVQRDVTQHDFDKMLDFIKMLGPLCSTSTDTAVRMAVAEWRQKWLLLEESSFHA